MDDPKDHFEHYRELDYYKENPSELLQISLHEILVPIIAVRGYSDLLIKELGGPINEKQREFLNTILRNEEMAIARVQVLRDLTTIVWDKLRYPIRKYYLSESLIHVVGKFISAFKARSQEFIFPDMDTPEVMADTYVVENILSKILDNANKYTPKEGKITLAFEKMENYVRVSISDTGIGIETEEQAHIFKLFFRSETPQVRTIKSIPGMGTSLFLCKHYVEYFGGQIGFESEPGKGSTFWFTLPIATDDHIPDQPSAHPRLKSGFDTANALNPEPVSTGFTYQASVSTDATSTETEP